MFEAILAAILLKSLSICSFITIVQLPLIEKSVPFPHHSQIDCILLSACYRSRWFTNCWLFFRWHSFFFFFCCFYFRNIFDSPKLRFVWCERQRNVFHLPKTFALFYISFLLSYILVSNKNEFGFSYTQLMPQNIHYINSQHTTQTFHFTEYDTITLKTICIIILL